MKNQKVVIMLRKNPKKTLGFIMVIIAIAIILSEATVSKKGNSRLFDDQTYHFEALRVLDHATSGGADLNEVLQTCARIEQNNDEQWYQEWKKTAERVEGVADQLLYDNYSKGLAYARAHNYYRATEFFMSDDDVRKKHISKKMYETFNKSLNYKGVVHEIIEVPYEGKSLKAIYYPGGSGAKEKPLLVAINGYDSTQEETYFMFVNAALKRGFSVITIDGPGQGTSIRERGILFTHEWHKPMTALIDKFIELKYEPKDIVMLGDSLGGVLVTRAAAFEKRITGIINYDIFYDFAEASTYKFPQFFRDALFSDEKYPDFHKLIFKFILKTNPKAKWAITHGSWVMGIEEPWELLKNYKKYRVEDIADKVDCHVLLLAGEKDHFVPIEYLDLNIKALTNAKSIESIVYDEESGGHEHCQIGAPFLWRGDVFNWIEKRFN